MTSPTELYDHPGLAILDAHGRFAFGLALYGLAEVLADCPAQMLSIVAMRLAGSALVHLDVLDGDDLEWMRDVAASSQHGEAEGLLVALGAFLDRRAS